MPRVNGFASRASGSTGRENEATRKSTSSSFVRMTAKDASPSLGMARQRPVREAIRLRLGDGVDDAARRDGPQPRRADQEQRGLSLGDRRAAWEHLDPGADLRLPPPERGDGEVERLRPRPEAGFVDVVPVRRRPVLAERGTDLGVGDLRCAGLSQEPVEGVGRAGA